MSFEITDYLRAGIIEGESAGIPDNVHPGSGAFGLYQFIPSTAKDLGIVSYDNADLEEFKKTLHGTNAERKDQWRDNFWGNSDIVKWDDKYGGNYEGFVNSKVAQNKAYDAYHHSNFSASEQKRMDDKYVGRSFVYEGKEHIVTYDGLGEASQFGKGWLNKYLDGKIDDFRDGNEKSIIALLIEGEELTKKYNPEQYEELRLRNAELKEQGDGFLAGQNTQFASSAVHEIPKEITTGLAGVQGQEQKNQEKEKISADYALAVTGLKKAGTVAVNDDPDRDDQTQQAVDPAAQQPIEKAPKDMTWLKIIAAALTAAGKGDVANRGAYNNPSSQDNDITLG